MYFFLDFNKLKLVPRTRYSVLPKEYANRIELKTKIFILTMTLNIWISPEVGLTLVATASTESRFTLTLSIILKPKKFSK